VKIIRAVFGLARRDLIERHLDLIGLTVQRRRNAVGGRILSRSWRQLELWPRPRTSRKVNRAQARRGRSKCFAQPPSA
jgi:hypothetical protein